MIAAVVVFAVFFFAVNDVRAHMHNMMKYASVMSPDMKFQLQWAYNNETRMLYFKMKCKNTGWCGVGFADSTVNQDGANMMSYDVAIGGSTNSDGYLWVSLLTISSILPFLVFFYFLSFFFVRCTLIGLYFNFADEGVAIRVELGAKSY